MIRISESKPDRQLHRCLHTGAMDESNTGAPRTPDLTDGKDVPGGCACGRSRPPPPFHRRRSSIVYMFKTEPDRQLRGCLYTGVMDKSNTCSWEHGRPHSAMPCMLLPLAHYPDTTPSVLPQISTLEYLCTRPAMRIGWMRIARWSTRPTVRVLFGVWGGPGEGEERGREASYRECSRVSEPCRCARLLFTPRFVKMTIW